jgi:hypothetical protein
VKRHVVGAVLAILAVSCGGDAEPPGGSTPTGTASLSEGRAGVELTGELRERFEVPLDVDAPNIWQPPNGGFALSWAGEEGQGLGIGGHLFEGSRDTDEGLTLTITARGEDLPMTFASSAGECRISILVVERDRIEGTFDCLGLSAQGTVVDATGVFSAEG